LFDFGTALMDKVGEGNGMVTAEWAQGLMGEILKELRGCKEGRIIELEEQKRQRIALWALEGGGDGLGDQSVRAACWQKRNRLSLSKDWESGVPFGKIRNRANSLEK